MTAPGGLGTGSLFKRASRFWLKANDHAARATFRGRPICGKQRAIAAQGSRLGPFDIRPLLGGRRGSESGKLEADHPTAPIEQARCLRRLRDPRRRKGDGLGNASFPLQRQRPHRALRARCRGFLGESDRRLHGRRLGLPHGGRRALRLKSRRRNPRARIRNRPRRTGTCRRSRNGPAGPRRARHAPKLVLLVFMQAPEAHLGIVERTCAAYRTRFHGLPPSTRTTPTRSPAENHDDSHDENRSTTATAPFLRSRLNGPTLRYDSSTTPAASTKAMSRR